MSGYGIFFCIFPPLPPLLTSAPTLGTLNFPKHYKACRSLRQRPTLEKRAAFSVSATDALRAFGPWDAVTYWRNNVLMFVRLRRPCSGRGALFRLFLFPTPKHYRWLMYHSISLSRSAALCGGFLPLELLARKLARFGESEALQALLRLPLSLSSRVRWTMYGTSLSVEVAA